MPAVGTRHMTLGCPLSVHGLSNRVDSFPPRSVATERLVINVDHGILYALLCPSIIQFSSFESCARQRSDVQCETSLMTVANSSHILFNEFPFFFFFFF